jgi:CRP-like cAMP-binding protein
MMDEVNATSYSCGNRLLDALPVSDHAGLRVDLEIIALRAKQATHSAGQAMAHIDFPIDAVLSVVATLKNGDTIEVGTVGSESFVESDAALSSSFSARTSFCQVEGRVGRMSLERFEQRMKQSDLFARSMRQNVRAVLFSAQQFTVCNLKHSIVQRCARWLAMTADRVGRPDFTLSREFLGIMLGAAAAGVTGAVVSLEDLRAIEYRGNAVTILDRGVLEGSACECYEVTKAAFVSSLCE